MLGVTAMATTVASTAWLPELAPSVAVAAVIPLIVVRCGVMLTWALALPLSAAKPLVSRVSRFPSNLPPVKLAWPPPPAVGVMVTASAPLFMP